MTTSHAPYEGLAPYYDLLYRDVDHAHDVAFLREAFERHAAGGVLERALDLGCGTGLHAIRLARDGVRVVGVDLAEGAVRRARENAAAEPMHVRERVRFERGDMAEFDARGPFDAIVSLFGSFNYVTDDARALGMLRRARDALRPGGILAIEFWNPVGIRPQMRWNRFDAEDGSEAYYLIAGTYDVPTDEYRLRMELVRVDGERVLDRVREDHALRARTPALVKRLVEDAGLEHAQFAVGEVNAKSLAEPAHDAMRVIGIARRPV